MSDLNYKVCVVCHSGSSCFFFSFLIEICKYFCITHVSFYLFISLYRFVLSPFRLLVFFSPLHLLIPLFIFTFLSLPSSFPFFFLYLSLLSIYHIFHPFLILISHHIISLIFLFLMTFILPSFLSFLPFFPSSVFTPSSSVPPFVNHTIFLLFSLH